METKPETQEVTFFFSRSEQLLGIAESFEKFLDTVLHIPGVPDRQKKVHRLKGYCEQLKRIADEMKAKEDTPRITVCDVFLDRDKTGGKWYRCNFFAKRGQQVQYELMDGTIGKISVSSANIYETSAPMPKPEKMKRTLQWWGKDFQEWEGLIRPGVKVIWRGANDQNYRCEVLRYHGGNLKLKFEDGHESEPCYIEQIHGVETETEIITIVGHDLSKHKTWEIASPAK